MARISRDLIALLGAGMLLASAPALAQEPEEDLTALSLAELVDLRLTGMALTNIHHTHEAGEWMVGYQYMTMSMNGLMDGSGSRSRDRVLEDFMVTPTSMTMEMHMLHLMYAITDEVTVMGMVPYIRKSMDHETRVGGRFATRTRGIGDIGLTGLFSVWRDDVHRVVAEAGVSFPSGSIDEKDETPMSGGGAVRLPYPMQLGSGSYELHPGVTYLGQSEWWMWGANVTGEVRLNENDNDYRLGDSYHASAWIARLLTDWWSVSIRPKWQQWTNIRGADPRLNPMLVPTADPDRRAGRRLDLLFGTNLFISEGLLEGHKVAVEGGIPIYQWLDGPALETDYSLAITWTLTF